MATALNDVKMMFCDVLDACDIYTCMCQDDVLFGSLLDDSCAMLYGKMMCLFGSLLHIMYDLL